LKKIRKFDPNLRIKKFPDVLKYQFIDLNMSRGRSIEKEDLLASKSSENSDFSSKNATYSEGFKGNFDTG